MQSMKLTILIFMFTIISMGSDIVNGAQTEKTVGLAGKWPLNYCAKDMSIDNERKYVFLGDGDRLNVLTPDLELILTTPITTTGQFEGMYYESAQKYLYTACRTDGLKIFDMTDVEAPVEIGKYKHPNSSVAITGVYVDNNRAYLACGISGALVVDVSDSASPSLLQEVDLPGAWVVYSYAVDAYANSNYFWIADLLNGIRIVDVEDIDTPKLTNVLLPNVRDLEVSGSYMYASVESGGMDIIDISDPKNPERVSIFLTSGNAEAVSVDGNFAYVAYEFGSAGIRILDVTDKAKPITDKQWAYAEADANSIIQFPGETSLYITSDQAGMKKIDASEKTAMHSIASFDTPADAVAIDVMGSYAYILDNTVGDVPEKEGLRILEISIPNPESMLFNLSGYCATPGEASDIFVTSLYAYVADGLQGLEVIDIQNKNNPKIIGHMATSGFAAGVYFKNNYAYVAESDQGLSIIDVSTPTNPTISARLDTPGNAYAVFVSGDYAYIADSGDGLVVVDIKDKTHPRITGSLDLSGNTTGVYVENNYAYMAAGNQGLVIIDITVKNNPVFISSLKTPGNSIKISVSGSYAYVANGKQGVYVINISDKTRPIKENNWAFGSEQGHSGIAMDVFSGYSDADENLYALIANGPAGIESVYLAAPEDINTNGSGGGGGGSGCFIRALFK
jgi:hypothetical protein